MSEPRSYRAPPWFAALVAFSTAFLAAVTNGSGVVGGAAFGAVGAAPTWLLVKRNQRDLVKGDWDGITRRMTRLALLPVVGGVVGILVLVVAAAAGWL
jgi:predicted PurR-regulated permease PerM